LQVSRNNEKFPEIFKQKQEVHCQGTALQAQERRVDDYKEKHAAFRLNMLVFR